MLLAATRVAEDWTVGNVIGGLVLLLVALAAIYWAIRVTLRR